jgi:hypothetical protein
LGNAAARAALSGLHVSAVTLSDACFAALVHRDRSGVVAAMRGSETERCERCETGESFVLHRSFSNGFAEK